MKASIAEVRRKEISNILKRDGNIHTEDIAKKFHVTTETIRKDIKVLQEQGLAVKCHGGAMAVGECVINRLSKRAVENSEVKKRIAEKAVELVHDQAILYIGPGSTCLCIAQLLASFADLTIFTSSLPAAEALADSRNRVYVLGGRLNGSTMSVHGMWSNDVIGSFAPNIAFLGSSGASGYPGPTCGNFEETETTKKFFPLLLRSLWRATVPNFPGQGWYPIPNGKRWMCWLRIQTCPKRIGKDSARRPMYFSWMDKSAFRETKFPQRRQKSKRRIAQSIDERILPETLPDMNERSQVVCVKILRAADNGRSFSVSP